MKQQKFKQLLRRVSLVFVCILLVIPHNVHAEDMTVKDASKKLEYLMQFIMNNYVGDVETSEEELYKAAVKGIFSSLDTYSEYYDPSGYNNFVGSLTGEFGGIGSVVTKDGDYVKIVKPLDNSPSKRAGIISDDIIIKVDGEDIKGLDLNTVLTKIRGEVGEKITLTFRRGDEVFTKVLVRELVKPENVKYQRLSAKFPLEKTENNSKIWYMEIDKFNDTVAEDFNRALQNILLNGGEGVIIDVRDNLGGYLDQVIKVCQEVVPEGPIVHTVSKDGDIDTTYSHLDKTPLKIVVLANHNSASASEIFVGAIKDSKAGVIVGETTFGKGVVQRIYNYGDNIRFKLTVEEYLTRNKTHIHQVGIDPDVEVIIPEFTSAIEGEIVPGQEAPQVKSVEEILMYMNYGIEKADTIYDQNTVNIIKEYQAQHKMVANGKLTTDLVKTLNTDFYNYSQKHDAQMEMAKRIMSALVE